MRPPFPKHVKRTYELVPENAAGSDAMAGGVNPWAYWGEFAKNPAVVRPAWRDSDDIVDGWDWSLPPDVKPSPRAKVRWGFHGWKKLKEAKLPEGLAVVDEVWWSWRKIEPEEGRYDFGPLRAAARERVEAGCAGVIVRLLGSVWAVGHPEEWKQWEKKGKWRFGRWSAPRWLEALGARKIVEERKGGGIRKGGRVVHLDIFDPVYHARYLKLVEAFGRTGLPASDEVKGLIICGMSFSNGEEASGVKLDTPERERTWRERVQAWVEAFGPHRQKLIAMGDGPAIRVNTELGVGSRDGFVEMYLYHADDPVRGQYIDEDRYLCVDESNFYVAHPDVIFGDENEEYREGWVDRFGPLESFRYRYFTSMLRVLQMRRNYLYTETNAVIPELIWYVCHELGRTVEDAPDAWCVLRESYLRRPPGPLRNFERWLHQRDRDGYETTPAVRIPHAIRKWWLHDPKRRYDYVARVGPRIGFAANDRFLSGRARRVAVKVTYYDGHEGAWKLVYRRRGRRQETAEVWTRGADAFRTATFFVTADFDAEGLDYDIEVHSRGAATGGTGVPISFVRVVKLEAAR